MPPATLPFPILLNPDLKDPLYKQLSDQIRSGILNGQLKPGDFLPATRNLADELGVSRFTVVESYRTLTSQGYLEAGRGAGSRVSRELPDVTGAAPAKSQPVKRSQTTQSPPKLSQYGERIVSIATVGEQNPYFTTALNYGGLPLDLLPLSQWRRKVAHYTKSTDSDAFQYWSDPQGYPQLREAIAAYISRARAVKTCADQVAVFSGYQQALECIARVLLNPGDLAVVENPGYVGAGRIFAYQGANIFPVSVDEQGLQVSKLHEMAETPKIILTTPSLQEPTGVALSLPRRLELLEYARTRNIYIIEDDYDSEYRYGSRPIPALQSLDENDRVIYLTTFRKMLFPLVRLAFVVLPPELVPVVKLAKASGEKDLPMLEQCVLTDLINEGELERHIQKTRTVFNKSRQTLVQAIAHHFGRKATISRENSGTHLVVRFHLLASDEEIIEAAREYELDLVSTRYSYIDGHVTAGEFLWSFINIPDQGIGRRVQQFARAIKPAIIG
ncbi:MAG: PLP-dependent aminotransferase family protein [Candidatus Melainabacteria bacterium]|nr:MAG: PLP-dependent aminotransferase family protein [Candidatus Melainabacteria bacterium]